jgi:hypothetical protein
MKMSYGHYNFEQKISKNERNVKNQTNKYKNFFPTLAKFGEKHYLCTKIKQENRT